MNKKTFIGGTFAAVAAIVAASSFISCSSDDEYYENGNYTLANKKMTRAAEIYTSVYSDTVYTNYGFYFTPVQTFTDDGMKRLEDFTNVSVDIMTYRVNGDIKVQMIGNAGDQDFLVGGVGFKPDGLNGYILCAGATYRYMNPYTHLCEYHAYEGVVPNTVFK